MVQRALVKRSQITGYILNNITLPKPEDRIPIEDHLTEEDWHLLIKMKEVLKPLYHQTKQCEGWGKKAADSQLWEVMSGLLYLIDRLEAWKRLFDKPTNDDIDLTASQLSSSRRSASSQQSRSSRQAVAPTPLINSLPTHSQDEYTPQQ